MAIPSRVISILRWRGWRGWAARYLLALVAVGSAFALRELVAPLTGRGAPFVLFFGATLVTSLFAGVGPGLFALGISLPVAAFTFIVRAGDSWAHASFQAMLYAIDGVVIIYLMNRTRRARGELQVANQQLASAHEAIMRSASRTREVIDLAPDALFLSDPVGLLCDVNRAACQMLGYSGEELLGRRFVDLVVAEDMPRLLASLERANGGELRGEWTLERKDGTTVPVEMSARFLPEGRWQAFVRDITSRRRMEDERQVFVSLIENAPDFIGIADPAGTPVYVNPAGRKLVGLRPDQPVEQTRIPDYYPHDHRSFASNVIVKSMLEQGRWAGETYFRNWQTEAAIPVSDEHFMVRDASGKRVIGMATITRDISAARRVEREQRFLADAGAVLASSLDYEQTLTTVGQLAVREFADWCVVDVLEEDGPPRRLKVVSRDPELAPLCEELERFPVDRSRPHLAMPALEEHRSYVLERVSAKDLAAFAQGPEHLRILRGLNPLSLMEVPLLLRGRLLGVVVFVSSTPSRVFGPVDLRLAEALAERAAVAIENGRLYRQAVQAKSLRDNVLGVVAHDLRNPLSTILLQAGALRRHGPEPERRNQRPVDLIERVATRMNRLIEDLLDVTRLEAGQLGLERAWIAPEVLLRALVESQLPLAASASLELDLEVAGPLPRVWGDGPRLEQVLENLVGNAIKFTGPGGRIRLGAETRGGELVMWVADTGRGIAPEELPRVFDRFWQAQRATRRGAGLGLPIARGIVEAHGGRIWVESTPGAGSTFFLSIPARVEQDT